MECGDSDRTPENLEVLETGESMADGGQQGTSGAELSAQGSTITGNDY